MPQLNFKNRPYFGHGEITEISNVLRSLNIKKPLICTDPGLVEIGMLDLLRNNISNEISSVVFDKTPANPTEEAVEIALEKYKLENCDGVIGFGGGSSLDLGKTVALMANHGGKATDYSVNEGGIAKIKETVPMVGIPTTSGTGSEVSGGAVIVMNDGRKLILVSNYLVPDAAICDPDLTMGLPALMTAGAGMDALTHCIEAILSPHIDPPAEAVGLDGVERIIRGNNLVKAVADGSDKEARWNMMMASTEGAMAFSKGLGAVHSMSHALGADKNLKLHHGTLNGVILPTILRFNKDHVDDKYNRICRAMGISESTDLAGFIEELNKKIGLPSNLSKMGVTEDMIPWLVDHSTTDPSNQTTPRLPSKDEWERLFLDSMS